MAAWTAPAALYPEWQLELMLIRHRTLQVREDLRNDLRLLDAGNDLERAAAAMSIPDRTSHAAAAATNSSNPLFSFRNNCLVTEARGLRISGFGHGA